MGSRWMAAAGLALVGGALLVCARFAKSDECCTRPASAMPAVGPDGVLAAWEPVDPGFAGCQQSCGMGRGVLKADAHPQPGARAGDVVYCPVSGAVFPVSEQSTRREWGGKTLYFCCAACAAYFDAHQAEVLAKRGLAGS